ncbi:cobalamin biosynthesis protein CbiM [Photobacterium proteolyticum]|uniref:Cobalamin biosynthesis protein CbiM n=1 Tax=Photobacterium proteolyticum TaxID=1903952 RepID=A0A1Q9GYV4_9GAMM|nr:cobalt transporter CbiM [Photobacterium proteolyticum]OLQ80528.1 cobalamin biosynthesis protein CbiM [Photobacterium proteolyticum]
MHIVDGVLSTPVLAVGITITVLGTGLGLRSLSDDKLPQAAVLAACFFVASLIHIPLGPTSVHLIFNGLIGLLLGWAAFPVVLIGLVLQAVFFGFGGLIVLGVNCLNIALPAIVIGLVVRPWLGRLPAVALGFAAGFGAVLLTALFVALSLALSGEGFITSAKLVVIGHLPVAVIEGVVSAFALKLLCKVRPSLAMSSYQ